MDTLTHALSGALLARATEPRSPTPGQLPRRLRQWVGFWAAAFPDSDFVLRFIDPLMYLTTHRGITHSILLLPVWALGLAYAFMLITRRRYDWRAFLAVCALGIAIHILGDVITAFGTMVFAPVSDARVALPFTFIIDPYFTGILAAGLLASALSRRGRRAAVAGLSVLVAYVGSQAMLHERAVRAAEAYATARGVDGTAHALPQPFSPFNWMLVIEQERTYHLAYVNLLRREPAARAPDAGWFTRVYSSYAPVNRAEWLQVPRFGTSPMEAALAERVWHLDLLDRYRHFARFPALYRIDRGDGRTCVWFNDLRFALVGRTMPFRYGACEEAGTWRLRRLVGDGPGTFDPRAGLFREYRAAEVRG
ncbi:hydrolase [Sulfurifustis variabilis]|uniref:Hydrolase n=2 Tax=Sulfurifustis variabilis TaxID=1675686 RepID=A0A1B4V5Z3_9GAMM|nr:hydrolase [Sulfurifustis variabilis]